ncbi:IS66 family transposase [Echinicola marina]|uniref:IS66 family transposase n=1 Tax=Echinicola marina TaxID=2859768 RepID=UPI001CF62483|nr:IS66 family transposase [Echinicola marina]UCS95291.1 IS66 family transposase [Echinicola marina]
MDIIILFDYQKRREQDAYKKILEGFKGYLLSAPWVLPTILEAKPKSRGKTVYFSFDMRYLLTTDG